LAFIFDEKLEAKVVQEAYEKAQSIIREDDEYNMVIKTEKEAEDEIKGATRWGKAQMNIEDAWGV
jgi:uncharacterized protein involved in tolerance to divalent cations